MEETKDTSMCIYTVSDYHYYTILKGNTGTTRRGGTGDKGTTS